AYRARTDKAHGSAASAVMRGPSESWTPGLLKVTGLAGCAAGCAGGVRREGNMFAIVLQRCAGFRTRAVQRRLVPAVAALEDRVVRVDPRFESFSSANAKATGTRPGGRGKGRGP